MSTAPPNDGDVAAALSGQMARWHLPLEELDGIVVYQYEEAFARMVGAAAEDDPPGQAVGDSAVRPAQGLRFASLPSMLAVMNLAVGLDELAPIAEQFALLPDDDDSDASVPAQPESAYDLLFDWPGTAELYEHLLPSQNSRIHDLFSLFSFLDGADRGAIQLSDLRHALCRMGAAPLSDVEFDHMLYRHRLLHRATVTVFEFMRVLLDVPVEPMAAALLRINREEWADRPAS
jgi:hypothetical protein